MPRVPDRAGLAARVERAQVGDDPALGGAVQLVDAGARERVEHPLLERGRQRSGVEVDGVEARQVEPRPRLLGEVADHLRVRRHEEHRLRAVTLDHRRGTTRGPSCAASRRCRRCRPARSRRRSRRRGTSARRRSSGGRCRGRTRARSW